MTWGAQRPAIPGDGIARGGDAAGRISGGRCYRCVAGFRRSNRGCPGRSTCARHRSPRHQACQYFYHYAFASKDSGLRFGKARCSRDALRNPLGLAARPRNSHRTTCCSLAPDPRLEPLRICHPSKPEAKSWTRAPIFSVWAPCYTKWRQDNPRSAGNTSAVIFDAILNRTPAAPVVFESQHAAEAGRNYRQGAGERSRPPLSNGCGASRGFEAFET